MLAGELYIKIKADTSDFDKSVNNLGVGSGGSNARKSGSKAGGLFSKGFLGGMGSLVSGIGSAIVLAVKGALAGLGVILAGFAATIPFIMAASAAEEGTSKFAYTFASEANEVNAELDEMSTRIRRGKLELMDMASSFGSLLAPMGHSEKAVGDMSLKLTELASDLASFYNTSDQDATRALFSGLVGETEALRRFGVQLNATRIEQEALTLGLVKNKNQITPLIKSQAIYSIILKDTAIAQGDAQRTGEGFANSFRNFQGIFRDVAAQIGDIFLPSAKVLVNFLSGGLLGIRDGAGDMKAFGESIAEALQKGIDWFGGLFTAVDGTRTMLGTFVDRVRDSALAMTTDWDSTWEIFKSAGILSIITIKDAFMFTLKNIPEMAYDYLNLASKQFVEFGTYVGTIWKRTLMGEDITGMFTDMVNTMKDNQIEMSMKWANKYREEGMSDEAKAQQDHIDRVKEEARQRRAARNEANKDKQIDEKTRPPAQPTSLPPKGKAIQEIAFDQLNARIQASLAKDITQTQIRDNTAATAEETKKQTLLLTQMQMAMAGGGLGIAAGVVP